MMFNRQNRRLAAIARNLRRHRPQPGASFVDSLVTQIGASRAPAIVRPSNRVRLGVGFAMTVVLLVVLAAFGGIGYAKTAVVDTATSAADTVKNIVVAAPPNSNARSASPNAQFLAALAVYPAPILTCPLEEIGSSGKLRIQNGTTTLAQGTIHVEIDDITASTVFSTEDVPATSPWSSSSSGAAGTVGHVYQASITQTASGFADGHCTSNAVTVS